MPGLVDVHCHIGLGADGPVDRATAEAQALADRDAGTLLDPRRGVPRRHRVGARARRPAAPAAGRPPPRPPQAVPAPLRARAVRPRRAARRGRRGGAHAATAGSSWSRDWIDRDLGPDADLRPLWPDDVLADAVAAAHAAGARVTAHTFATEALPGLLAAGVDCLEHGTGLTPDARRRGGPARDPGDGDAPAGRPVRRDRGAGRHRFPVYAARMRRMHARRYAARPGPARRRRPAARRHGRGRDHRARPDRRRVRRAGARRRAGRGRRRRRELAHAASTSGCRGSRRARAPTSSCTTPTRGPTSGSSPTRVRSCCAVGPSPGRTASSGRGGSARDPAGVTHARLGARVGVWQNGPLYSVRGPSSRARSPSAGLPTCPHGTGRRATLSSHPGETTTWPPRSV